MSTTITTVFGNVRSSAVQIAADIAGVELKTNYIQWKDLKSKENLALHPQGQVPSLQTPEGNLTQTNALLAYVASVGNGNLYGTNDFQKAQVDQWLSFVQYELSPALKAQNLKLWGFAESSEQELKESREKTEKLFDYLNKELKGDYFVGSEITIADIVFFTFLVYAYRSLFSAEFRAKYSNVTAWFERVAKNASVAKFYGVNRYASQPWF